MNLWLFEILRYKGIVDINEFTLIGMLLYLISLLIRFNCNFQCIIVSIKLSYCH